MESSKPTIEIIDDVIINDIDHYHCPIIVKLKISASGFREIKRICDDMAKSVFKINIENEMKQWNSKT